MRGKGYSATLAPSPELLAQVRERYQTVETEFRAVTGYGFDGLTESEARYLAKHDSPESVRNRIIEESRTRGGRVLPSGTGEAALSRRGSGRGIPRRDAQAGADITGAQMPSVRDAWVLQPATYVST